MLQLPHDALLSVTIFIVMPGMMALVWRALSIAQALAELALKQNGPQSKAPPVIDVTPVTHAPPLAPLSTQLPSVAVDDALVSYIKKQEGFRAKAYWDFKQWSIGYGTRATSPDETVDEQEADKRLRVELALADKDLTDFAQNLPKGVHQALLDLTYNAGSGWQRAKLGELVRAQNWAAVKADLLNYNHAGGKVNADLTARRSDEAKWISEPI